LVLVGLIVLIVVAVGAILYQARGPSRAAEASRQEAIKATMQGPPGTFTPAPR
jgi:hypothetical protein